jgi:tetratricopeptide (TPR) repeat protein
MRCLERDPDLRPQTMSALEYELTKSTKGRGAAVALALGLKTETGPVMWAEESSKPRIFADVAGGRVTPPPTESAPILLDNPIRLGSKVTSPEAVAETIELDEAHDDAFHEARRAGGSSRLLGFLGGVAFLAGAGYLAWRYQPWKPPEPAPARLANKGPRPFITNVPQPAPPPPKPVAPTPVEEPDEKMSAAEIGRMLEWARRTAEGGRILAPPGDNLKELLDRIENADPGNADAASLRQRTSSLLLRRGSLATKRGRLDEAVESFEELRALAPDDAAARHSLTRTLRTRAMRLLERKKAQAALTDATQALELEPDDALTRLVLADAYLALGKHEQAADEYERVLEDRPTSKHAKSGLAAARQPKPTPKRKKR